MVAAAVTAVVILLLILLTALYVKIRVRYDGEAVVKAGAGPFMIKIYPSGGKDARYLSAKEYKRLTAEKSAGGASHADTEKRKSGGIGEIIDVVKFIIGLLGKYSEKIHGKINKLAVTVSSDNAAAAAIKYGAVTQGVGYLYGFLEEKTSLDTRSRGNIDIRCDYLSDGMTIECDILLKVRVINIIRAIFDLAKYKIKTENEKGKRKNG